MIQQRHRLTATLNLLGDLVATVAAFLGAWVLRFEIPVIPLTKNVPEFGRYLEVLPWVALVFPVVFHFHGLYQAGRRRSRVDEALTILLAVVLATLILSGLSTWYRPALAPGSSEPFTYSRAFLAIFPVLEVLFVVGARNGLRALRHRARIAGLHPVRILVVGAGQLGREVAAKLQGHRELGFHVVGFLDDDPNKQGGTCDGIRVLGPTRAAAELVPELGIDQIYVALPLDAHRRTMRLLQEVGRECVEIKLVPDILQYATLRAAMEDLDGTPVINLAQVPLQGWSSMLKRAIDFFGALAGLLVLSPLFGLIALAIWLQDGRPIFYRQERMGLDGRAFMIWKFRSMRRQAEATTGPVWAVRDDPRRTRLGTFLRQWSLDELPQLWNVLIGEMSLVGPRPERPVFVREFKQKLPQYMVRHRVKAGITGWAQVHGWRGNTSIRKRLEYDLYYIENWSLALDFKILWMTLRVGLRQNAY
ncbi:MAG: undecaprenyl-phosphate glucose phosphotransferase [Thermoanaerobaculia bacterium]|nr:undecaprenyl-phosphate glucose phosphotransferase [Thermoanaerobaculia bacterium]MCZ7650575.1 undecaprenyl-phosphate glucose phosphotransferase [Thermoanaerobaculia bacterium]